MDTNEPIVHQIEAIRLKTIDILIRVFSIIVLPMLLVSLFRVKYTGWLPIYFIHIALGTFVVWLGFFRNKLALNFKVISFISIITLVFIFGVFRFGLFAGSLTYFYCAILLSIVFSTQRVLYAVLGLYLIVYIVVAFLFTTGKLLLVFDEETFISLPIIWISYGFSYFGVALSLYVVVKYMFGSYTQSIANIAASESKLSKIIQLSPVAMALFTPEQKVTVVNDAFFLLFGYAHQEVDTMQKWAEKAFPDESYRSKMRMHWASLITDYKFGDMPHIPEEIKVYCKNGDIKDIELRIELIEDIFIATFIDHTEKNRQLMLLKEREFELREQNHQYEMLNEELTESLEHKREINELLTKAMIKAEESDKLKSAFLANMSHEIRTPMNSIIGFSDLMLNHLEDRERLTSFIGVVLDSSRKLLQIVNDVLEISKIESGTIVIRKERILLSDIITSLEQSYQKQAVGQELTFGVNFAENAHGLMIETDKAKLFQIINNILGNAFKFTHIGGVEMEIYCKEKALLISVRDTGIGIATESIEIIFERFRQVETSNHRNYGGTGLGLSIASELIQLLGGSITVESTPGIGSVFTIIHPL